MHESGSEPATKARVLPLNSFRHSAHMSWLTAYTRTVVHYRRLHDASAVPNYRHFLILWRVLLELSEVAVGHVRQHVRSDAQTSRRSKSVSYSHNGPLNLHSRLNEAVAQPASVDRRRTRGPFQRAIGYMNSTGAIAASPPTYLPIRLTACLLKNLILAIGAGMAVIDALFKSGPQDGSSHSERALTCDPLSARAQQCHRR